MSHRLSNFTEPRVLSINKILITGGTGYIGSHTAIALLSLGYDVVLFDNLSNSNKDVVGKISAIAEKDVFFIKGDVCNSGLLREIILDYRVDAVIHFAGLKAVGESIEKPIDYYVNNVQGTVSLLKAMSLCSIRKLVFSSSATVYGHPEYLPVDENHPTRTTNPYARSKLHIEEMLKDVASSNSGWKIVCLRYFNPVGAHESGLIGEFPNGIPNNLMPYISQVAAGQRKELKIFGDDYPTPDGTGVRDYIHVMDLAEGHVAALEFIEKNTGWHAINLGTGRGYSVLDMVRAFEQVAGKKVVFRVASRRSGDVAECYANPGKATQVLNWKAYRNINEMCLSAWNFQKSVSGFQQDFMAPKNNSEKTVNAVNTAFSNQPEYGEDHQESEAD